MNGTISGRQRISGNIHSSGDINAAIAPLNNITGEENGSADVNGTVRQATTLYIKEIEFKNHYEFPNVGEENMLYVATDECACYIFDIAARVYKCVGKDYNEIEAIQAQLREE